jgi:hypothetical protein
VSAKNFLVHLVTRLGGHLYICIVSSVTFSYCELNDYTRRGAGTGYTVVLSIFCKYYPLCVDVWHTAVIYSRACSLDICVCVCTRTLLSATASWTTTPGEARGLGTRWYCEFFAVITCCVLTFAHSLPSVKPTKVFDIWPRLDISTCFDMAALQLQRVLVPQLAVILELRIV